MTSQPALLLLGNANSIFVRDYAAQCVKAGFQVDVLSVEPHAPIDGVHQTFAAPDLSVYGALKRQWLLYRALRQHLKCLVATGQQYDCVMLHFVHFYWALQLPLLRRLSANFVAVVWGSDFYRVTSKFKLWLQQRIYNAARHIVFTNDATRIAFQKRYPNIPSTRLQHACFGLPVLTEMDQLAPQRQAQRAAWCAVLGLDASKKTVMVGYNANLAQQQLRIIAAAASLPTALLSQVQWVFPLGYGSPQTQELIRAELAKCSATVPQLNAVLLTQFLNFQDAAKLRLCTDLLINIQPSDQFSGSMQESLYAGAQVLTGAWLPYDMLQGLSEQLHFIQDLDELPTALATCLSQLEPARAPSPALKEFIAKRSSWSHNWPLWQQLMQP